MTFVMEAPEKRVFKKSGSQHREALKEENVKAMSKLLKDTALFNLQGVKEASL